ncbi:MAG: hypothetical protein R2857_06005 [Vampirovibrionales bacterium]
MLSMPEATRKKVDDGIFVQQQKPVAVVGIVVKLLVLFEEAFQRLDAQCRVTDGGIQFGSVAGA